MPSSRAQKVKIVGVPLDIGSKPLGVEMGPSAIRYAGLHEALKFNKMEFEDKGDLRVEKPSNGYGGPKEIARVSEELAGVVSNAIAEGFIPLVLGGDHSVSIGSIAGAAEKAKKLGVIWVDCHPDANTPETSPSGNIHGMTVAICLGQGYEDLVQCRGFSPKVRPEDLCIIGAKDIDEGEKAFLDSQGVRIYTLYEIEERGIVEVCKEAYDIVAAKTDLLHVSFDVDVLDPLLAPGTGIQSRGGLSYREISYVMQYLGKRNAVGSMDVIEINPLLDVRNQTSELAVELVLSSLGGSFGDYERNYLRDAKPLLGKEGQERFAKQC